MGKLTDSLKSATQQLGGLKQGIAQMQDLGQELADNAGAIAEVALRAGYAYAKAEALSQEPVVQEPVVQEPLDQTPAGQDLSGEPAIVLAEVIDSCSWTLTELKTCFGTTQAAYAYLKTETGLKLRSRSWQALLESFQGAQLPHPGSKDFGAEGVSAQSAHAQGAIAPPDLTLAALHQRIVQLEAIVNAQASQLRQQSEEIGLLRGLYGESFSRSELG